MSPQAALEIQIAHYREITPEQPVLTALQLHELLQNVNGTPGRV